MEFNIRGNPDYGSVDFHLDTGDRVFVESGSMSQMSADLPMDAQVIGSKLGALGRKLVGGESFFLDAVGRGKLWLQTRTLPHTAGWITLFLRG